mmetsp:Transcript_31027/g.96007  ORF Transcript_31027/g.96007 Transcript_31027/m.96007 type:complete len:240 (-) Transcript_31027:114-833(-)
MFAQCPRSAITSNRTAAHITTAPCISKLQPNTPHSAKTISELLDSSQCWYPRVMRMREFTAALVLSKELDCLACIMIRETCLDAAQRLALKLDQKLFKIAQRRSGKMMGSEISCEGTESRLWAHIDFGIVEIVGLVKRLRLATLDVVEAAVAWRETERMPFQQGAKRALGVMYAGQNYLVKMTSDFSFLGNSLALRHYEKAENIMDIALLPIDNDILKERCLLAADQIRLEVRTSGSRF